MERKSVVFIPARGGSKGIPNKNLQKVDGVPLVVHAIKTALEAHKVSGVWVSTDSPAIVNVAQSHGANVIVRPGDISGDRSSTEEAMTHFAKQHEFDTIVLMQCTSPLTLPEDIENVLAHRETHDSVVSVCEDHGGWLCGGFRWYEPALAEYDTESRPMRQQMSKTFRENGALYATSRKDLLCTNCRISGKIKLYQMPRQRSFEIDSPEDLQELRSLVGGNSLRLFSRRAGTLD